MYIIWLELGIGVPMLGLLLWAWLRDRRIDKYNKWLKQQEEDSKAG